MAIKRISDLPRLTTTEFNTALVDSVLNGTQLNDSIFEISWNTNPSMISDGVNQATVSSSGDDNTFASKSVTFRNLRKAIVDEIQNRTCTFSGNKTFNGTTTLKSTLTIQNGALTVNSTSVASSGKDVKLYGSNNVFEAKGTSSIKSGGAMTIVSSGTIAQTSTGKTTITGNGGIDITASSNPIAISGSNITLTSSNGISIGSDNSGAKVISCPSGSTLKIKIGNTEVFTITESGVTVKGAWVFSDSQTYPIDGYIKHAQYT